MSIFFYVGIKQSPNRTIVIQPILQAFDNSIKNCETLLSSIIDNIYNDTISVLTTGANNVTMPKLFRIPIRG